MQIIRSKHSAQRYVPVKLVERTVLGGGGFTSYQGQPHMHLMGENEKDVYSVMISDEELAAQIAYILQHSGAFPCTESVIEQQVAQAQRDAYGYQGAT